MMLKFSKMHGLGNDFIVIDGINQKVSLSAKKIAALADRHLGIGFDQCLVVEKSFDKSIDFRYKIYNANGAEVGQCGNGARCLGKFIKIHGLSSKNKYVVATSTTLMEIANESDESVTVSFAKPCFEPAKIPLLYASQQEAYSIPLVFDKNCLVHAVSVGNPHAVLMVSKVDDAYISKYGAALSNHKLFPEQVNVGFMRILSNSLIELRVYERGCGETKACGSGAVAAAAIGIKYYGLDNTVIVKLPGGNLQVTWPLDFEKIYLNGPATFVFNGQLEDF